MTGKERMLKTLRFEEPDRRRISRSCSSSSRRRSGCAFPTGAWDGCTPAGKDRMIGDMHGDLRADRRALPVGRAGRVYWPWSDPDGVVAAKRTFGDEDPDRQHRRRHRPGRSRACTDWKQFAAGPGGAARAHPRGGRREDRRAMATFDRLAERGPTSSTS